MDLWIVEYDVPVYGVDIRNIISGGVVSMCVSLCRRTLGKRKERRRATDLHSNGRDPKNNSEEDGRMILETKRLYLREMEPSDYMALCAIMQDEAVMRTAYTCAFSNEEVWGWLNRHLERYRRLGFGLWAVVLKQTGEMIGQCGLTLQPWEDRKVLEIGYLFARRHWHQGYAAEAAVACREYAFRVLHANEVCSIIRDTNTAAQKVALRCGMVRAEDAVKRFRGVDMRFYRYVVQRKAEN